MKYVVPALRQGAVLVHKVFNYVGPLLVVLIAAKSPGWNVLQLVVVCVLSAFPLQACMPPLVHTSQMST